MEKGQDYVLRPVFGAAKKEQPVKELLQRIWPTLVQTDQNIICLRNYPYYDIILLF
jgi:hypothetical protein